MSGDPMDSPPADHGSDRYDYIEVQAPKGIQPPLEVTRPFTDADACADCRANVFLKFTGKTADQAGNALFWRATIAHDETCPAMAAYERRGRG